jgi:hypothetical protein
MSSRLFCNVPKMVSSRIRASCTSISRVSPCRYRTLPWATAPGENTASLLWALPPDWRSRRATSSTSRGKCPLRCSSLSKRPFRSLLCFARANQPSTTLVVHRCSTRAYSLVFQACRHTAPPLPTESVPQPSPKLPNLGQSQFSAGE